VATPPVVANAPPLPPDSAPALPAAPGVMLDCPPWVTESSESDEQAASNAIDMIRLAPELRPNLTNHTVPSSAGI
jgi:hypothetical protein